MDQTPTRSEIIQGASTIEGLVHAADAFDPALSSKLRGGATLASASPVGSLVGGMIGLVLQHYEVVVDPDTQKIVVGALVLAGGYMAHFVQKRVTSIVPPKK